MASRSAVASAVAFARPATCRRAAAASVRRCVIVLSPAARTLTTTAAAAVGPPARAASAPRRSVPVPLPRSTAVSRRYSAAADPPTKLWTFADIQRQLQTNEDKNIVLVDVREPAELRETGKIPGAVNIPVTTAVQSFHVPEEDFEDAFGYPRPAKDKTLVFYCKAGVRAKAAAGLALHAGWKSVGEYRGSWLDWAEHGGPVEKVDGGK
ncbi:Rhodanese-like protein [Cordyceps fumosorosea ARSEF 2679]|uniref:Rhodanese-like protein n=1 Tax=Cordyceps fumosorosea (strain ARSEF 2679) TaxID=1081104 RepID=A0A168APY6_CORFA|nr:Rhodanese-like protein [Cordyceps fumosorosea ARSEF 2679]OAA69030.1 Rhodanese-like protein [Cordyceps fumosorosea ARSEF 2679]